MVTTICRHFLTLCFMYFQSRSGLNGLKSCIIKLKINLKLVSLQFKSLALDIYFNFVETGPQNEVKG